MYCTKHKTIYNCQVHIFYTNIARTPQGAAQAEERCRAVWLLGGPGLRKFIFAGMLPCLASISLALLYPPPAAAAAQKQPSVSLPHQCCSDPRLTTGVTPPRQLITAVALRGSAPPARRSWRRTTREKKKRGACVSSAE